MIRLCGAVLPVLVFAANAYAETHATLVAARWYTGIQAHVSIAIGVGWDQQEADADGIAKCVDRDPTARSYCKIIGRYAFGSCGYLTLGYGTNGYGNQDMVWASGRSEDEALSMCYGTGASTCHRSDVVGYCTDIEAPPDSDDGGESEDLDMYCDAGECPD